ncbi:hypothetical protein J6590_051460 [Homalodisca vitripennis]|nr:hypothetical protein J6590_051460 [Homalodisca vitripennis]
MTALNLVRAADLALQIAKWNRTVRVQYIWQPDSTGPSVRPCGAGGSPGDRSTSLTASSS